MASGVHFITQSQDGPGVQIAQLVRWGPRQLRGGHVARYSARRGTGRALHSTVRVHSRHGRRVCGARACVRVCTLRRSLFALARPTHARRAHGNVRHICTVRGADGGCRSRDCGRSDAEGGRGGSPHGSPTASLAAAPEAMCTSSSSLTDRCVLGSLSTTSTSSTLPHRKGKEADAARNEDGRPDACQGEG